MNGRSVVQELEGGLDVAAALDQVKQLGRVAAGGLNRRLPRLERGAKGGVDADDGVLLAEHDLDAVARPGLGAPRLGHELTDGVPIGQVLAADDLKVALGLPAWC